MPDHLPDVNEGDETLLNSRSFRFAGYLNRLKEAVGRIWTTDVQDAARTRDPSGQTYLYKDRRTEVVFSLNKSGEILEVKVGQSSGVFVSSSIHTSGDEKPAAVSPATTSALLTVQSGPPIIR